MFVEGRETKSKLINIKMTPKQRDIAHKMAEDRGTNLSQLVMLLLEKEYKTPSVLLNNITTKIQDTVLEGEEH